MFKLSALAILVTGLFIQSGFAFGSETPKIAVVDMQRAIQTVESGKKAKSQLEKEIAQKRKNLQGEESAIKKLGEEFKKQSLVMNEDARNKKQTELQERIIKFQELTAKTQQELQQK